MTIMETIEPDNYELLIVRPLKAAVEKAGGSVAAAKRIGILPKRLRAILHDQHMMRVDTLMMLCKGLDIYLVFIDSDTNKKLEKLL